jgi:hypothetical protein
VQRDVESLAQVSCDPQFSTGVQSVQTLANPTWSSQVPSAHCVHCESNSLPHVIGDSQRMTGVQAEQRSSSEVSFR